MVPTYPDWLYRVIAAWWIERATSKIEAKSSEHIADLSEEVWKKFEQVLHDTPWSVKFTPQMSGDDIRHAVADSIITELLKVV